MEQREISFRAWSPFNKEMYFQDDKDYQWRSYSKGWGFVPVNDNDDSLVQFDTISEDNPKEHIIMMQYTGLKDGAGKEIYEGDLLQFTCIFPFKSVVEFTRGGFISRQIDQDPGEMEFSGPRINPLDYELTLHSEIIGNIHQHPHLLTNQ